jgi:hypothetical protein
MKGGHPAGHAHTSTVHRASCHPRAQLAAVNGRTGTATHGHGLHGHGHPHPAAAAAPGPQQHSAQPQAGQPRPAAEGGGASSAAPGAAAAAALAAAPPQEPATSADNAVVWDVSACGVGAVPADVLAALVEVASRAPSRGASRAASRAPSRPASAPRGARPGVALGAGGPAAAAALQDALARGRGGGGSSGVYPPSGIVGAMGAAARSLLTPTPPTLAAGALRPPGPPGLDGGAGGGDARALAGGAVERGCLSYCLTAEWWAFDPPGRTYGGGEGYALVAVGPERTQLLDAADLSHELAEVRTRVVPPMPLSPGRREVVVGLRGRAEGLGK